ncbi:LysR family transcriptional regulator [Ruminococcaceae bacterium OttesenSCG-928-I18]|nr:LysR family transcriptional regulator [Ruminococcaceae bacterium OttesenSCG-928-I18]
MDFKQLEAFAYVVDFGSFSKAAEKLHLTQPTVSAHISSLESELETQLIVRTSKSAYPSDVGKLLYEYASDMLSLRENAIEMCRQKRGEVNGVVNIAASTIPYQYVLPTALADFREIHPDVTFKLLRYDSAGVVSAVLSGKAELGMTGTVLEASKLVYHDIRDDELVLITPPLPPYSQKESSVFPLEEIPKSPFIVREPGSGTRKETEEYLQKSGIDPASLQVVAQMDNPDAVKSAVSQGLGISITSKLSAVDFEKLGLLKAFSLGEEKLIRKLYITHHKNRPLSRIAKAFLRFVSGHGAPQ